MANIGAWPLRDICRVNIVLTHINLALDLILTLIISSFQFLIIYLLHLILFLIISLITTFLTFHYLTVNQILVYLLVRLVFIIHRVDDKVHLLDQEFSLSLDEADFLWESNLLLKSLFGTGWLTLVLVIVDVLYLMQEKAIK